MSYFIARRAFEHANNRGGHIVHVTSLYPHDPVRAARHLQVQEVIDDHELVQRTLEDI